MSTKTNSEAKDLAAQIGNSDVLDFGAVLGTSVERKLKFKPRPEFNNLCKGRLVNVEVSLLKTEANDKNGLPSSWEYAGLELPNLKLTFVQEPTQSDPAERVYEHYFSPFTNVKKNGEAIDRATIISHYTEEYKQLRHIANAFTTNANYDAKVVIPAVNPFIADPIARLEGIKTYYQAWATLLSGKEGKGFMTQVVWLKLTASPEGTYLRFPPFVGEGFIEKVIDGRQASIELKPSETVELVKKDKAAKGKSSTGTGNAPSEDASVPDEIQNLLAKYTKG